MFSLATSTWKAAWLNPRKNHQLHDVYAHVYVCIHVSTDTHQNIKMPVMVDLLHFPTMCFAACSHCIIIQKKQEFKTKCDCQRGTKSSDYSFMHSVTQHHFTDHLLRVIVSAGPRR